MTFTPYLNNLLPFLRTITIIHPRFEERERNIGMEWGECEILIGVLYHGWSGILIGFLLRG